MTTKSRIPWIVRPARLEDKEAVDALLRVSYESLLPRDYEAALLEKALPKICGANERLLTCGTWYVVVHPQSGAIVGCGGWTPDSPMKQKQEQAKATNITTSLDTSVPNLRHFATHPDWTRQGVARSLWNRIWEDVQEFYAASTASISMEVLSTLAALPFYASLGFIKVQEFQVPLADDCHFPSVLMRRDCHFNTAH